MVHAYIIFLKKCERETFAVVLVAGFDNLSIFLENGIFSKIRKKISRNKSTEKPELDYNATQGIY